MYILGYLTTLKLEKNIYLYIAICTSTKLGRGSGFFWPLYYISFRGKPLHKSHPNFALLIYILSVNYCYK